MSKKSAVNIDDINMKMKSQLIFSIESVYIRGCSVLPSGKIILANNIQSTVLILIENCKMDKEIPIDTYGRPWDVIVIDDNTVAVS